MNKNLDPFKDHIGLQYGMFLIIIFEVVYGLVELL